MKTKKLILGLALTLSIIGCNSSSSSISPQNSDYQVTVSECQKDKESRSFATATNGLIDNKHTYIAHHYKKNTLTLTHHNVVFNCDKRGIGATAKIEGDNITIIERQTLPEGGGMRCMCLYDVGITLENIEAKSYTINYDDGISTDIHFDVDLSEMPDGVKSFARTDYPYNQESSVVSDYIVTKVIVDNMYDIDALPDVESKILKSQDELDSVVVNLRDINNNKTDKWADILENLSIDFKKEKLLTHTFEEACIYGYRESIGLNSNQEVTIHIDKMSEECATAMTQYYLVYKISNSVKSVKLEILGREAINVDMGNLILSKKSNIF